MFSSLYNLMEKYDRHPFWAISKLMSHLKIMIVTFSD